MKKGYVTLHKVNDTLSYEKKLCNAMSTKEDIVLHNTLEPICNNKQ